MTQNTKVPNEAISRHPAGGATRPEWWPRRLTRQQVSERLGRSPTSVRRLEGKTLHPVKGSDGVWGFDPAEVEAYAANHAKPLVPKRNANAEGELAAEAFELFNAGKGYREAVAKLRQPPAVVRALYRDWGLDGDLWVSREHLWEICSAIEQQLPKMGTIRVQTADDLQLVIDELLDCIKSQRTRLGERGRELETLRSWKDGASKELARLRADLAAAGARDAAETPGTAANTDEDLAPPAPVPQAG